MLSRVNEYARVKDDEMVTSGAAEEKRGNTMGSGSGKYDKSKRNIREDFRKVSEDGYKGVNAVFTKPIHKIMFDIHNKPYFEWLKPMGGNPVAMNTKLRCSCHKDHGHKIEHCKTLK